MKTSELTGPALDWAVAKCAWEPTRIFLYGEPKKHVRVANRLDISHEYNLSQYYTPSTDWSQGGPIIERERIPNNGDLVEAMRCYVTSKLGDDVDIPEELL